MNKITKIIAGFVGIAAFSVVAVSPASALTTAELQAQIATLTAQLSAMSGGSSASAQFTSDMGMGASGASVSALQNWLISNGYAIPAGATGYYGAQTAAAVKLYQASKGIPQTGYVGPLTRAALNATAGVPSTGTPSTGTPSTGTPSTGTPSTSSDLEGGAGSVESYTLISGLNNEEVGEDAEDVEVAGLEVEADEGSDLELMAVKLVFNEGTATSDFEDYASEVSIWLGDEELARVDADEFTDETGTANDWTKTVTLDKGGIIKAGETEDLVLKVSGISNLDSADQGDTWTIDFTSVRFKDATGTVVSEDPGTNARTFSFDTFATSNEVEMKVNLTSSNPKEQAIVVENDGDKIDLLTFKIKAEGSDVELKEIPVALTSANADLEDISDELVLEWDGGDASQSIPDGAGTTETVTFDDLSDVVISAGETVEFTVYAKSATSTILDSQGITISGVITVDNIIAEDETGEDIADADASGSVTGETQHLFSTVPEVVVKSVDIDPIANGDAAAEAAKATIKFEITARGGTIYLNGDNESTENKRFFVGKVYGSSVTASTTASSTQWTVAGNYTTTNSGSDNEYYTLNEDDTMTIEVEATVNQSTVTTSPVLAGLKALLLQYGTASTDDTSRAAIDLDWSDLTDLTQTGTESLVNPS